MIRLVALRLTALRRAALRLMVFTPRGSDAEQSDGRRAGEGTATWGQGAAVVDRPAPHADAAIDRRSRVSEASMMVARGKRIHQ